MMAAHEAIVRALPPGRAMKRLATHGRFAYSPIDGRPRHDWPNGGRLALYIGFNVEHFAFGEGLGARLVPRRQPARRPQPLVARVWQPGRCLAPARAVRVAGLPLAAVVNSALAITRPSLIDAFARRGDEIVATATATPRPQGR
jgi:hypothetical protein